MTHISFYKSSDPEEEITSINVESCPPLAIGQQIHLSVSNRNREVWDVEDILEVYTITGIEHYASKTYAHNCMETWSIIVFIE